MGTYQNSQLVKYLRRLARGRKNGRVSADDIQTYLTRQGFVGGTNERLSIVRRTLSGQNFVQSSPVKSRRPEARGRVIYSYFVA
jgi:hypothetical protein